MIKTKDTPKLNNEYEILYFLPITLSEDEIKKIHQKINEILEKNSANIHKEIEIGKRKLSYMIKGVRHGYYILTTFYSPTEKISKIKQELNLVPEITRYRLIKRKHGQDYITIIQKQTQGDSQEEAQTKARQAQPDTKSASISSIKPSLSKQKPEKTQHEKDDQADKEKKEKVDIAELDKKIDELLGDQKDL